MQRLRVEPSSLDDLLRRCDIVSLHCPGGECVLDPAAIALLRPGVIVLNTARAELVDEVAMATALWEGRLAAFVPATTFGTALRK
jgi:D-3-phosphoglycerate dehydrogenase